jgi:hypothetical protein
MRWETVNAKALLTTSVAALNRTCTIRGGLLGRQNDCIKAAHSAATTSCEKLKKAIATRRKAKLGEMVLVIPGMRTFSVEARREKQSSAANCGRLAEDHHLAARNKITVPEANTSAMYRFATLDIEDPSVKDSAAICLVQIPVVSVT